MSRGSRDNKARAMLTDDKTVAQHFASVSVGSPPPAALDMVWCESVHRRRPRHSLRWQRFGGEMRLADDGCARHRMSHAMQYFYQNTQM